MGIVTIGIDLAKNVFAVHGVDATGKAVLVRALPLVGVPVRSGSPLDAIALAA